MKIQTKLLKSALDNLRPITRRRVSLPILSCIKLSCEKGKLRVEASNLDEHAYEFVEADGRLEPFCVSFEWLSMALSGEELDITFNDKRIKICAGVDLTELATMDADEFPPELKIKGEKAHGLACGELAKAIRRVSFASGRDDQRDNLCMVNVESKAKGLCVVATNGHSLAVNESATISSECEFNIPIDFTDNAVAFLQRAGAVIVTGDNQIKVTHDLGVYYCKQSEATYPNWRSVVPAQSKSLGTLSIGIIRELLDGCCGYSDEKCESLVLAFEKRGLEISLTNPNGAELHRHIDGKFEPFKIAVSVKKLQKIFHQLEGENVSVSFVDAFSPLIMKDGELTVLLMPMRLT